MTAQVFRSGQQPTFYVSDAMTPAPGGGIDGSFRDMAVGRFLSVGGGPQVGALQSGNYNPVWTTVSGFSSVGQASGSFIRVGNFVMVAVRFLSVTAALGANIANITVPFPPPAAFGGTEATGTCTMDTSAPNSASSALLTAQVGLNQVRIVVTTQAGFNAPLNATFIYSIA